MRIYAGNIGAEKSQLKTWKGLAGVHILTWFLCQNLFDPA